MAKLTKTQLSARAKKAARTRKRNAGKTPAKRKTRRTTTSTVKRRRTVTKHGGLAELFNPKMAEGSFRVLGSGAVGGVAAIVVEKFSAGLTPQQQAMWMAISAFGLATYGKMPNTAAGLAAVAAYNLAKESGFLADNDDYLQAAHYAKNIEMLPAVLDENGDDMYLQEGEDMYLQDNGQYDVGYFPDGFGG